MSLYFNNSVLDEDFNFSPLPGPIPKRYNRGISMANGSDCPFMRPRLKQLALNSQRSDASESLAVQVECAHDLSAREIPWSELADGDNRVELEIGTGKGLFLESAAAARPDHRFIGIELVRKFADRAAQRIFAAGLANAVVLRGDAERFLMDVVPDCSVCAVYVYFPDPWWRRKHKKRRVLNEQSLRHIERVLQPDGQLHFWTDVLDYYELICGQLMELPTLVGPHFVPERVAQHDMDYTTHFERRARRNGQAIYRAIFCKQ